MTQFFCSIDITWKKLNQHQYRNLAECLWEFCVYLCLLCVTLYPFSFCNHLILEEEDALLLLSFRCIVFYKCSVALPHDAVCDCGIPDHIYFFINL